MPALDSVIRGTVCLTFGSSVLRRNVMHDLPIADKIIPKGGFLAYPLADTHLDPEIYLVPIQLGMAKSGRRTRREHFHTWAGAGHPRLTLAYVSLRFIHKGDLLVWA